MKRISLPLVLSLIAHGLILIVIIFWGATRSADGPLAGGGGGNGVTIEIIGGMGRIGQGGHEDKAAAVTPSEILPPKKDAKAKDQMTVKAKTTDKAKAGRRDADNISIGTTGPAGEGQGPGPAGPGSGEGGTNTALAQIRSKIERAKRYPVMARRMNIEGVSQVSFAIDASGQPQGLTLKVSSGSSVLDDEALSTIRRAAPFPAYGDTLEIGIRFEIAPP